MSGNVICGLSQVNHRLSLDFLEVSGHMMKFNLVVKTQPKLMGESHTHQNEAKGSYFFGKE